jgi:hypothetical protein
MTRSARLSSFFAAILVACGDGDPVNPPDAPREPDANVEYDASPPTTINIVVNIEPGATVNVIYQDGDGPWRRATDEGGGGFSFPNTTGRYGYGYTCADDEWQDAGFQFGALTDTLVEMYPACGYVFPPLASHNVSGHITGLTGHGYRARIGFQAVNDATPAAAADYSVDPAEGTIAIYFARFADAERAHADRLVIRRDVEITQDLVENVAFVADGVATMSRPMIVGGTDVGDQVSVTSRFRALGGGSGTIGLTGDTTAPYSVESPGDTAWISGDRTTIGVGASRSSGAYRGVSRAFTDPADLPASFSLTLPAILVDAAFSVQGSSAGVLLQAESQTDPAAEVYTLYSYATVDNPSCDGGLCFPFFYASATPAWVGSATTVTLSTPQPSALEALGAWDDRLDIPEGTQGVFYDYNAAYVADDFEHTSGITGSLDL